MAYLVHKERISFDDTETWHAVVDKEDLPKASKPWNTAEGCGIGCGAIIALNGLLTFSIGLAQVTSDWMNALLTLLVGAPLLLMFGGGIIWAVLASHKAQEKHAQAKHLKAAQMLDETVWSTERIGILDVQRKDTRLKEETSRSKGGGLGVGFEVAPGLAVGVGGGGGGTKARSREETIISWQFYTDRGVLTAPDDVYTAWLNAGKPNQAVYSVKHVDLE